MSPYYDQPLRKLLGTLAPTINWLGQRGSTDVNKVPAEYIEAVKQLERIGVVHKRNNRQYELQKIRLRKLMDSMGIEDLASICQMESPLTTPAALAPVIPIVTVVPTPDTALVG